MGSISWDKPVTGQDFTPRELIAALNAYDAAPSISTNPTGPVALNPSAGDVQTWGRERYDVQAPQNSPKAIGDGATDDQPAIANARSVANGKGIVYFPTPTTSFRVKRRILIQQGDHFMGDYRLLMAQVPGNRTGFLQARDQVFATLTTAPKVGDTNLVFTADPSANGLVSGDVIVITPTTPPAGTNAIPEYVQVANSYTTGTTVPLIEAVTQHGLTTAVVYANPMFEFGSTIPSFGGAHVSFEGLVLDRGMAGIYCPNASNYVTVRDCDIGEQSFAGILTREFIQQWFVQDVNFSGQTYYGWCEPFRHSRDYGAGSSFMDKSYLLNVLFSGMPVGINWSAFVSMNNLALFFMTISATKQDAIALKAPGINQLGVYNFNTEGNAQAFIAPAPTTFTGTTGTATGTVGSATGLLNAGHKSFVTIRGAGSLGVDFYGNIDTIVSTTLTFKEPAPVMAPTFQDGGAAATTLKAGTYTFKITYVNTAGETTGGPTATATLALDGNKFTVPDLNSIPWLTGITSVKFYMLTAPGGVTPGLVATRSLLIPQVTGNTGLYADSGSTVAAFDITAGGASQTPPGANTANQNLGRSVTGVELYTAEYCDVLLMRGGGILWANAEIGSGNGGGLRYAIDHRGGAGVMSNCGVGRPVYDPGSAVVGNQVNGDILRPAMVNLDSLQYPTIGGGVNTPRTNIPSPLGNELTLGLVDSTGGGSGSFGNLVVRRNTGGRPAVFEVDAGGHLYVGPGYTPTTGTLNAHVSSATPSGTDLQGSVDIVTDGTGVAAGQKLCTVTFANNTTAWRWAPNVRLIDATTDTTLATVRFTAQAVTASKFDIYNSGGALTLSKTYTVQWIAIAGD